jgi:hypothetical protein
MTDFAKQYEVHTKPIRDNPSKSRAGRVSNLGEPHFLDEYVATEAV